MLRIREVRREVKEVKETKKSMDEELRLNNSLVEKEQKERTEKFLNDSIFMYSHPDMSDSRNVFLADYGLMVDPSPAINPINIETGTPIIPIFVGKVDPETEICIYLFDYNLFGAMYSIKKDEDLESFVKRYNLKKIY